MSPSEINSKDEMIINIRERILDSGSNDTGLTINLENFSFSESGRSNSGIKMSISCLFVNEDGKVCADMYRWGAAGVVDFICGRAIDALDENILRKLISTLDGYGILSSRCNSIGKQKKRRIVSAFRIPFHKKGA